MLNVYRRKLCDCPENRISCLNRSEWLKNQVGIWEFYYEARDIRNKKIHPATFPISLARRCIELFTHKGGLVLDPFAGTGTTLLAARDAERNCIGFDLKKEYVDYANLRLGGLNTAGVKQIEICDDAVNINKYLEDNSIDLSISSPPYACILNRKKKNISSHGNKRMNVYYDINQQYSDNPKDLGNFTPQDFPKRLSEIYKSLLPLHKINSHCVINISDIWWENRRVPLHISVINEIENVGYRLRNIIIWDKRNLVNKIGVFGWPNNFITISTTYEYILDFVRP